jgi:hypothetical protein
VTDAISTDGLSAVCVAFVTSPIQGTLQYCPASVHRQRWCRR